MAQYVLDLGGPKVILPSDGVPEGLTSERCFVALKMPTKEDAYYTRGDWKKLAAEVHYSLRRIGIDAIGYSYLDDLDAGPEMKKVYLDILNDRQVRILISLEQTADGYTLAIVPFDPSSYMPTFSKSWVMSSTDLENIFLSLGRQVLRQDLDRSNFIIPEGPEFLAGISIYGGTRYSNYPSRLQSLNLAVVPFQKIDPLQVPNEARDAVQKYNRRVDLKNARLGEILKAYPFKYDLVDEIEPKVLYDKGYQYVLLSAKGSAAAVRKLLGYDKDGATPKEYETVWVDNEGGKSALYIPAQATVIKYYIKQTAVNDLHVGDEWDASVDWEQSIHNFLENLRTAFKR